MNKRDIKKAERTEKVRKIVEEMIDLVDIKYDNRWGNIDKTYNLEKKKNQYLLYFDGYDILVESVDEVMSTPFIDGKTLSDVTKEIKIYHGQLHIY